jgi:hypothetical protein
VRDLCGLADVVMFSAGIPTQLGTGHVNLQPQGAWVDRFGAQGYRAFDLLRPQVWHDDSVEVWYRQNTIVYVNSGREDLVARAAELTALLPPMFDIVHPGLVEFWHRRATRPVSTTEGIGLASRAALRGLRRRLRR